MYIYIYMLHVFLPGSGYTPFASSLGLKELPVVNVLPNVLLMFCSDSADRWGRTLPNGYPGGECCGYREGVKQVRMSYHLELRWLFLYLGGGFKYF